MPRPPDDVVAPFLRITDQDSQRGTDGSSSGGITYEVTGPFRTSV